MVKKFEAENEKYIRLYERYKVLLSNLNQNSNNGPIVASSLALSVVILVVGEKTFNIVFPDKTYITGMVVGGITPLLPSLTNRFKLYRTENQLFRIANIGHIAVVNSSLGTEYSFSDYKRTCIENYYNNITEKNNGPVKKLESK